MLSHAMDSSETDNDSSLIGTHSKTDEFDESPTTRPSFLRVRSRTTAKVDFCLIQENMIRCVCANIIAHIQKCDSDCYIPPEEYQIFNKESGSLVCTLFISFFPSFFLF